MSLSVFTCEALNIVWNPDCSHEFIGLPCQYSLVKPSIVNIVLNLVWFALTKASQVHWTLQSIFTHEAFYCKYRLEPSLVCTHKSVTSSLDSPVHIHSWSLLLYIFSWTLFHFQSQVHWTVLSISTCEALIVETLVLVCIHSWSRIYCLEPCL